MASGLLGRTNQSFPPVWLSLTAPTAVPGSSEALVEAALAARTVIDISSSPALWGGQMRGTDATIMGIGKVDLSAAMGEPHAHDLVQAHLIETLCGIGRDYLDFYFLSVGSPLKESQISGALIALEAARQEGHVRFVGIAATDASASMGVWQLHDAFEALLIPGGVSSGPLRLMAKSRRVAIVTRNGEPRLGEAALVSVATPEEVERAMLVQAAAS